MEKNRKYSKNDSQTYSPYNGQYSSVEKATPRKVKLRIYLVDNEFKTIYVEEGSQVHNVLDTLAAKMEIQDMENFGIFEEWVHRGRTEEKLLPSDEVITDVKSRKIERRFLLKCKLFRELNIINANEPSTHLYYIQTKANILSGYFYAGLNNATALAAIQMQIEFGPHSPEKHKLGFMQSRIRDFVSNNLLEKYGGRHMEVMILEAYALSTPV